MPRFGPNDLTPDGVLEAIESIDREAESWWVAAGRERGLWETVLEVIAAGAPDPVGLATAALETTEIAVLAPFREGEAVARDWREHHAQQLREWKAIREKLVGPRGTGR